LRTETKEHSLALAVQVGWGGFERSRLSTLTPFLFSQFSFVEVDSFLLSGFFCDLGLAVRLSTIDILASSRGDVPGERGSRRSGSTSPTRLDSFASNQLSRFESAKSAWI
jgi:hypothetical protein